MAVKDWFNDNGFGEDAARPGEPQPVVNDAIGGPAWNTPAPAAASTPVATVGHDATASTGLNREQYRDLWQSSGAKSLDDLKAFIGKYGGTLNSDNGTITTPYGDQVDALQNARGSAAGQGEASAAWNPVADTAGSGTSGSLSGGGSTASSSYDPVAVSLGALGTTYQPTQTAVTASAAPQTFDASQYAAPSFSYDATLPELAQQQTVTPLTAEQLQNDPAYQFRLQQGIGALQNSAAARGSVRDANVWKGLIDYGQSAASQEADLITNRNLALANANNAAIAGNNSTALTANQQGYNQALSGYQANLGALGQNANTAANAFNLNTNAALGYGNLGLGNRQADQSYSLGLGNLALGNKQADNSYTLGQGNLALNRDQFRLSEQNQYWNQAFNNNAQTWDQYYKLAQLGYPTS